jgi:Uma2 family endonuclease
MTRSRSSPRIVAHVPLRPVRRAEHRMAMPAPQHLLPDTRRRWTASEVRALIAANPLQTPRYELVDGELLVTSSPSLFHQEAIYRLVLRLTAYLEVQRIGRLVFSPSDVEVETGTLTQPDLFVLTEQEWRRVAAEGLPVRDLLLAIEVLSPSSRRHDLVKKRPLYQRHIPEYWAVDLEARLFNRWRPTEERPEQIVETLTWHPEGATEPFALDLPTYFAEVFGETLG